MYFIHAITPKRQHIILHWKIQEYQDF